VDVKSFLVLLFFLLLPLLLSSESFLEFSFAPSLIVPLVPFNPLVPFILTDFSSSFIFSLFVLSADLFKDLLEPEEEEDNEEPFSFPFSCFKAS